LRGETVDLFVYNMPALNLDFEYYKTIPIPNIYVLMATLGGRVRATTDLSFGFDTSGINQWAKGWDLGNNPLDPLGWDMNLDEIYKVFNGFYLGDYAFDGKVFY
jgi:hypothetical protein